MMNHNFKILNGDTDSITIYKPDFEPFTKEERTNLLNELNNSCPKGLVWEDDGYFKTVIVLKAKNYILQKEDGTVKYKGSSIKDTKKEPALRAFIFEVIQAILDDKVNTLVDIYNKYVIESQNINKDNIHRWVFKKSITEKVLGGTRANETKVVDALEGEEYQEGDKRYFFFLPDGNLCLQEKFNNIYDKEVVLEKLYKTSKIFENIIDKDIFINYSLKRNSEKLCNLLGIEYVKPVRTRKKVSQVVSELSE